MKKWLGFIMIGVMFLIAGCGSAISTEDLKANDWLVDSKDDETPNMIISFSDHVMSFKVDTSTIKSSADDEWEAMGEELAKQIFDQMNYKLEYELNKDEMKVQDGEDSEEYIYYKVTKEDKNIVLTPNKEKKSDDDQEILVLQPHEKVKEDSTEQSSISTEAENNQNTASTSTEELNYSQQTTFSNGKLETPQFTLTIDKTQVSKDATANEDGLIIWYTVENKSNTNLIPEELLGNLSFKQRDETSEYDIPTDYNGFNSAEGLFPMYNEDGTSIEDIDKYNEAIQKQNEFSETFEKKAYSELLPGATVQVVEGVLLHNTEYPVTVTLQDFLLGESGVNTSEEYTINLTNSATENSISETSVSEATIIVNNEEDAKNAIMNKYKFTDDSVLITPWGMVENDYLFKGRDKKMMEDGGSGTIGFFRVTPQGEVFDTDPQGNRY
ncbi:hypothetical protein [Enterococcus sp. 2201sp1_2201st1_B8_2201SCRN_220225]|uniref:hypothetical protein n=1 Tax=unclassified Enterococcus TaxID=2608891 RepID=UPI0034A2BCF9